MENDETTNPVAEAPEAEAAEVDAEETLAADDAEQNAADDGGEGEEEFEELDVDGEPLKAPKSIAEKLKARMMMQADYTQKTQALAEQRRELETQRQAVEWEAQTSQALRAEEAQLFNVRSRLDQFAQVNWQALAAEDASQYAALHAEYTQLKDVHDGLYGQIEGRKGQLATMREQATAISMERALNALNTPDPNYGWAGKFDAQISTDLTRFGEAMGFSREELTAVNDPRMIKALHLMKIGAEALRKQSATLKAPTPQAKPVPQVATGKTRTGPVNPDRLSADDWLKWRENQIKRKQTGR